MNFWKKIEFSNKKDYQKFSNWLIQEIFNARAKKIENELSLDEIKKLKENKTKYSIVERLQDKSYWLLVYPQNENQGYFKKLE